MTQVVETIILVLILLILLGLVSGFIFSIINSKGDEAKSSVDKIFDIGKNGNTNNGYGVLESKIPKILISWNYPQIQEIKVIKNQFFNVSFNVTCLNADCGNVNVSLDPKIKSGTVSSVWGSNYFDSNDNSICSPEITAENWVGFTSGVNTGVCRKISWIQSCPIGCWGPYPCMDILDNSGISAGDTFDVYNSETECFSGISSGKNSVLIKTCLNFTACVDGSDWISISNGKLTIQHNGNQLIGSHANCQQELWDLIKINGISYDYISPFNQEYPVMLSSITSFTKQLGRGEVNRDGKRIYINDDPFGGGDQYNLEICENIVFLEKELVNTTTGAKPFYTNESNPRIINLKKDESQIVNFWVNATGNIGEKYSFFAYANQTENKISPVITEKKNITISSP